MTQYQLRDRHSKYSKINAGFSTVIVLSLLAAITSLALASSRIALDHRTQSAYYHDRIKTRHAALSGIEIGRYLLEIDRTPWDGPGDLWYDGFQFSLNQAEIHISIKDEQGLISLNHLLLPSGDSHHSLMNAAAILYPEIPEFEKYWHHFMDTHSETQSSKSVSLDLFRFFLSRHLPEYAAAQADSHQYRQHFTRFGTGRINLNTASPEILRALGGTELERAVLRYREREPLESVFQLPDAASLLRGLSAVVDVRSSFFTISVTASSDLVTCHAEAVVWRRNEDLILLRHREWWS